MEFKKRGDYNKKSLRASAGDTKTLYKKVNRLLGKAQQCLPTHEDPVKLAEDFKDYFSGKVEGIRKSIREETPPGVKQELQSQGVDTGCSLDSFSSVSTEDLKKMVNSMSNKFCGLDPIPTFLLKQCFEELAPIL